MYEKLPQELKRRGSFCLWKYEKRGGDITKVPYRISGARGDSTDRAAFTGFGSALAHLSGYDGIGIGVFDDICAIDIDHCVEDGTLSDLACDIITRMDSYTEYSPSGTGVRILFRAALPDYDREFYYINNRRLGLEVYAAGHTSRFVTVTGNHISGSGLEERSEELMKVLEIYMRKPGKAASAAPAPGSYLSDESVLLKATASKQGEKFKSLWEGKWEDLYGSHSEADAALCAILAFWCGGDTEQMDRLFRQSGLYRRKWERKDYRERTLDGAVSICSDFYSPHADRPDFIRFKKNGELCVSAPALARHFRSNVRYILVRDNAKQGILIYIYKNGCYRLYSSDMMIGLIKGFVAKYNDELIKINQMHEVLQHITTDLNYVPQESLNADESIINFENTIIRITADDISLLPHSPDIYSTVQIPCRWTGVPSPTPHFDSFMNRLTSSQEDVIRLYLEFIGAVISNVHGYRMKKALFQFGPGDTGKTVLKSLVERIIGQGNFISIDLSEIEARFGTGAVYGTRLAGSSDMSFLTVSELKAFKLLTGGDGVFAEFKGQQGFIYTYCGLLWFCMNKLPKFGGDNGKWVYDRIIALECRNVIPLAEQDKQLVEKLYVEREGIIYRAVKALQGVIKNGYRFHEPQCAIDMRKKYMCENNTILSFYEECMCRREVSGRIDDTCTTGKIYDVYKAWCRDNNNGYAKTAKEFRETLADHLGLESSRMIVHTKHGNFYRDLTLTDDAKAEYNAAYGTDFLA